MDSITQEISREKVLAWVEECDKALAEMLPLQGIIADYGGFRGEHLDALRALANAAVRASGAALLLLENFKPWDADIIMRSVVESSLKFSHLLSSVESFENRYIEYAEALPDIATLKNHIKAQDVNEMMEIAGSKPHQAFTDLILTDAEFETLNAKYPSKIRREIESKWSFSGLLAAIGKEPGPHAPLCKGLGHNYSMSSRILHADWHGVLMIMEREYRSEPSRTSTYVAHSGRIISDIFWFSVLRISRGYKFTGKASEPLNEVIKRHEPLLADINSFYKTWVDIEYPASE